jgi:hypothetical protein
MLKAGVGVAVIALGACFGGDGGGATVTGNLRFVQGGTSGAPSPLRLTNTVAPLTPGYEYIVSPHKAKVTFTSVVFRDETGRPLEASSQAGEYGPAFSDCTITYDRSLASGSTLLDCDIEMPIGEVSQLGVYFDKNLEILVNDSSVGIYSNPASPTLYSTTAPAGGADFVPFTIMIGNGTSRATPIVFGTPISITADAPPQLYITTDMIQTLQMQVNADGTSLTAGVRGKLALLQQRRFDRGLPGR